MTDVSPYVAEAAEKAAKSEWEPFFLVMFEGDDVQKVSSLAYAADVATEFENVPPTVILKISPDCVPCDATDDVARVAMELWLNIASDEDLEAGHPPRFCQTVLGIEITQIIDAEIEYRRDEASYRREASDMTGRL